MADSDEKTEQPTAKRRRDQRKEGNIFQSKEIVTAVTIIVAFAAFGKLYENIAGNAEYVLKRMFSLAGTQQTADSDFLKNLFKECGLKYVVAVFPLMIICGAAAIIPVVAQTKGFFSMKMIQPKFSKLNPISGFKNMFSLNGLVELLKAFVKITILFVIMWNVLKGTAPIFMKFIDMPMEQAAYATAEIIWKIVKNVTIACVAIAALDFFYQRHKFEKKLKMTKQEVKEEFKQTEGDPKVKGKIKQKQREMSLRRMMQAVPEANVVIRNPTHYAVALKYEAGVNSSPVVVAKGADYLALKIISVAEENNVPLVENRPLARALYENVEVDAEIPRDFYKAVAEVLAFVYNLRKKENRY